MPNLKFSFNGTQMWFPIASCPTKEQLSLLLKDESATQAPAQTDESFIGKLQTGIHAANEDARRRETWHGRVRGW